MGLQRAGLHLFEAQRQHAIGLTALHRRAGQVQGSGTRGAIVVDVDHWDRCTPNFVESCLATGGVAIDVTAKRHLHLVVGNACIFQRQPDRLSAHLRVAGACTRLGKGNHADPGNNDFFIHGCLPLKCTLGWQTCWPAGNRWRSS
ncbi:hypothetical protein D3C77_473050 [compost metagenome]